MKSLLEYISESFTSTYNKNWKPLNYFKNREDKKGNDKPWLIIPFDDTFNKYIGVINFEKIKPGKYTYYRAYMCYLDELPSIEVKLFSDKGVFNTLKDIQDTYNTKEKNLVKLAQEYKIKMSLIFNNLVIRTKYQKEESGPYKNPDDFTINPSQEGKIEGKASFDKFSIVDIDLSNPDNNEAKYIYKNYKQVSIKKSVEIGKNENGGRVSTGYCSFTFNPYHLYDNIETSVLKDDIEMLPALFNELFKKKSIEVKFDNITIPLKLFSNQLQLEKNKYIEFRNFISDHIKSLNKDVLQKHKNYIESDDYKSAKDKEYEDNYRLMTNGL